MPRKQSSITRLATKNIIRLQVNRLITNKLGSNLLGSICKTLASQAIKHSDKIKYNSKFKTIYLDKG